MKISSNLLLTGTFTAALLLTGCGGGGDKSAAPKPPAAQTTTPPASNNDTMNSTSSTAKYKVKFTAKWTNTFGSVPGSAHFTQLAGSAVTNESTLWRNGSAASSGFEVLAETGATGDFVAQINTEVSSNRAKKAVTWAGTEAEGDSTLTIEFTRDVYHYFTFATMVAPSPDWFVGTDRFNLKNANGEWKQSETVELRVYDAGTENGNGFSLSNPATSPQGVITRLNETIANGTRFTNGLVDGKAIASVTFTRTE